MKQAVVLTHVEIEGPGRIGELLREQSYELDVRRLHAGDSVPRALERDQLLIVMGGPMGVADLGRPEYPFLDAEVALLRARLAADAPVLGVCLGAQLLAHAAGARVYPMQSTSGLREYEVGWGPIRFCTSKLTRGLPDEAVVLHWHGDTFDLPHGAERLAASPRCQNQGFRLGSKLFGLQFHAETGSNDVENFIRVDAEFLSRANGDGAAIQLQAETAHHMDRFREVSADLLRVILDAMTR